jgi:TPR repeat protein
LSADQGDANAQFNVGSMYDDGLGVPQNYKEALKWYRLAADQGNAAAQYNIGRGYYIGKNYTEALKWYRLSADQGDADAQCKVGYIYFTGLGVPSNYQEAYIWYSLAAANGNEVAKNNVTTVDAKLSPAQLVEAQKRASELFKQIEERQKLE